MGPDLAYERRFWAAGHHAVAGLDEVGRGALAGPVTCGAVILPPDPLLCLTLRTAGLRDSKRLSATARERLVPLIEEVALAVSLGEASPAEIDAQGIVAATRLAMRRALEALPCEAEALLLDAFPLPGDPRPQRAIIRGDDASLSIAAASVVAKVARDRRMVELDRRYPGYALASNKGYGSAAHRAALVRLGPLAIHRQSWKPLRLLRIHQPPLDGAVDGDR